MKLKKYCQFIKNINSTQFLQGLLLEGPHLPLTNSALDMSSLNLIINDILINKRKNIIEFGSGVSTILIARLARKNDLDIKIYSVDNDKSWIESIKKYIKNENLDNFVQFIYAPLSQNKETPSLNNLFWYNEEKINEQINKTTFDCVIVDGPYANSKKKMVARYPAYPYIKKHLTLKYSIFLDDACRRGERKVIKKWEEKIEGKFKIYNQQLAYYIKGECYNFKN